MPRAKTRRSVANATGFSDVELAEVPNAAYYRCTDDERRRAQLVLAGVAAHHPYLDGLEPRAEALAEILATLNLLRRIP